MFNVWGPVECYFCAANPERTFSLLGRTTVRAFDGQYVTGQTLHVLAVPAANNQTVLYEFSRSSHDQQTLDIGFDVLQTPLGNNGQQMLDVSKMTKASAP